MDFDVAQANAMPLPHLLARGKNKMPHRVEQKLRTCAGGQIFLADLFIKSIVASDICSKHMRNQTNAAKMFLQFMATQEPVNTWDDWLMSDHIESYIQQLRERNLSTNTLRAYANVFRLINRTVFRKTKKPKAEVQCYLPKRNGSLPKNYLILEKLLAAIGESRRLGNLRAELGFTLGGLCGLRLEEVAYLCKGDYNRHERTLFIHDSKNEYSTRTIPVPEYCQDVLERAFGYRDAVPRKNDPRNCLYWNHEPISNAMRKIMRKLYADTQDPAYDGRVKPMDARKTFRNTCSRPDIALNWWLVECYMGHKLPGEGESYQALRVDDKALPEIRLEAIETLREIPNRLDDAVKNALSAK